MSIEIKRAPGKDSPKPKTIEELVESIGESLAKTKGVVSDDRLHSVESHLRACIRLLGFKPTETEDDDGKVNTKLTDLIEQLETCVASTTELTEDIHANLHVHLSATASNCAAEVGTPSAPPLKAVPEFKQKKQQEPPGGADGAATLLAFLLGFASLFFASSANAAIQSFNFTNLLDPGRAITSYPTNTVSTNYWSSGTNYTTSQTNQFLLCVQTGNGVSVPNQEFAAFDVNFNYTSSNAATIMFGLVRASGASGGAGPKVLINTNTSVVLYSDWETQVAAQNYILIPLAAGTNLAFNWRTNIDVRGCDFIGIYTESNDISEKDGTGSLGSIGWASNIVVGLDKKIIGRNFVPGSF